MMTMAIMTIIVVIWTIMRWSWSPQRSCHQSASRNFRPCLCRRPRACVSSVQSVSSVSFRAETYVPVPAEPDRVQLAGRNCGPPLSGRRTAPDWSEKMSDSVQDKSGLVRKNPDSMRGNPGLVRESPGQVLASRAPFVDQGAQEC